MASRQWRRFINATIPINLFSIIAWHIKVYFAYIHKLCEFCWNIVTQDNFIDLPKTLDSSEMSKPLVFPTFFSLMQSLCSLFLPGAMMCNFGLWVKCEKFLSQKVFQSFRYWRFTSTMDSVHACMTTFSYKCYENPGTNSSNCPHFGRMCLPY